MRKMAFVLLVASAILLAASGLRAAPPAAGKVPPLTRHIPVLTLDAAALADDVVVYARLPSKGWAIPETINGPPVDMAVATVGLVHGTSGNGVDAHRMDQDWERQSKINAALHR